MASEQGQRVGDYEVLALLGSGGMGRVYKVRNVISNREEAMKILLPDFASEPELAARFMAEIRTLAGLEHPNIAQLRTAFQLQNQFVMVMEFVEGTTLDNLPAQLPLDQALEYSMQVLSALSYAHGKGVTHRDIKPANIMITSHGLVKLMDFGIAKSTTDLNLTRPGTTMGSIYYMSPEQVRGGAVDGRTDLYSFGVTLYEMLTGRKPFQAETSFSVLNAQLNEAPAPPAQWNPALSPELNDIILRAMAKDPAARFQSADEFRNALKAAREPKAAQPAMDAFLPSAAGRPVQPPPFQQTVLEPAAMPAPPNQGFTPVPAVAAPVAGKSHRGLWIGLGAIAAILALVAVATVLPHFIATHAGQKSGAAATATQSPSTPPVAENAAQQTPGSESAMAAQPSTPGAPSAPASPENFAKASKPGASATPASRLAANRQSQSAASIAPTAAAAPDSAAANAPASSAPSAPAGLSPQQIRDAHDRYMNLDARASSAGSGVQQIRSQQQAQGFDIRGDVLASMNRMTNFMREADRALSQNDLATANDYMNRADKEISKLESFLGR